MKVRKVIKILERHGFVLDRVKGSHHIYYNPLSKRRVVIPVHKEDLPRGTLHEILKQAGIDRRELEE
ncbi:MAG: type II toxin-antitoxin system HicA family toxin [Candidatus Methanodesulfokora sp.]|jgi:predicted RNA binding protein YcfA (HicA-like mRNA interferase family)